MANKRGRTLRVLTNGLLGIGVELSAVVLILFLGLVLSTVIIEVF